MSREHTRPGEVLKRLWDRHEVIRTRWLAEREDARAAIAGVFGADVAANSSFLDDNTWGKIACVRVGAFAWLEIEHAGVSKRVSRAVCVNGAIARTDLDFPLQELLQSALPALELTPQAICAAFQKFGTGGKIARGGETVGFERTIEIHPPTMNGDELTFVGRRGHRLLSCVCHLPSRRAWMTVLKTIELGGEED